MKISHHTKTRLGFWPPSLVLVLPFIPPLLVETKNYFNACVEKECSVCFHIACESETWNPFNLRWF